jgi:hypothetical protein
MDSLVQATKQEQSVNIPRAVIADVVAVATIDDVVFEERGRAVHGRNEGAAVRGAAR